MKTQAVEATASGSARSQGPPAADSQAPPETVDREDPGRPWGPDLWIAALGLALVLALDLWIPAAPGQNRPLRWVRVAADHPVRIGLSFFLIARSLGRRRRKFWTESAGTSFEDRANSL